MSDYPELKAGDRVSALADFQYCESGTSREITGLGLSVNVPTPRRIYKGDRGTVVYTRKAGWFLQIFVEWDQYLDAGPEPIDPSNLDKLSLLEAMVEAIFDDESGEIDDD